MSRKQQEISVSQVGNVAYASASGLTLLKIGDQPVVATGDFAAKWLVLECDNVLRECLARDEQSEAELRRSTWFTESAPAPIGTFKVGQKITGGALDGGRLIAVSGPQCVTRAALNRLDGGGGRRAWSEKPKGATPPRIAP